MGDALAHAIIPGIALAYILSLPYIVGAFFAAILATFSMAVIKQKSPIREDAIIGIVFTAFLAIGLVLASLNPISVDLYAIVLGNALAISTTDLLQIATICAITLVLLTLYWKDLVLLFFDLSQAQICNININRLYSLFFALLSIVIVCSLQTVGAPLVIAMLIMPGATAYLLTDNFGKMILISVLIGVSTNALGAYLSYFLNIPPGSLIVLLQAFLFVVAFLFAPKHGWLTQRATR